MRGTTLDAAERELFERTIAEVFDATAAPEVPGVLAEIGWDEVRGSEPEADGIVFRAKGRALSAAPLLSRVMLSAADLDTPESASVVLGLPGSPRGDSLSGVGSRDAFRTDGVVDGPAGELFALSQEGVFELHNVTVAADGEAIAGLDPEAGWVRIQSVGTGKRVGNARAAERARAAGRAALAHEMLGIVDTMLDQARDHAIERHQFGRPIGSFQAIQHKLADVYVAREFALEAAELALGLSETLPALVAKYLSGSAYRLAAQHCQQVLGGMGCTWEHPFHRSLKRGMVLESLLGSTPSLSEELGRRVIDSAEIPRWIEL